MNTLNPYFLSDEITHKGIPHAAGNTIYLEDAEAIELGLLAPPIQPLAESIQSPAEPAVNSKPKNRAEKAMEE